MTDLTALRTEVAGTLIAAGIKAVVYVGETITPPCAVVVPGQPYVDARSGRPDVFGGQVLVNLDVLLLVSPEAAKTAAERIDDLTQEAWAALAPHHYVKRVSRPGDYVTPKTKTKFIGSVIQLEAITEDPS